MKKREKVTIIVEHGWDPHDKVWCLIIRNPDVVRHWPHLAQSEHVGTFGASHPTILLLRLLVQLKKHGVRVLLYRFELKHAGCKQDEGRLWSPNNEAP